MGTFQKFCLRWNNHTTNLLGTLGHILTSEQHSDVTLCCQGEVWRLHKLVLCASSTHFEKLLGSLPPGHSPIVVLDGPHPQDVASLIHFIYHGEVNVDQENLASLLRTAESLKIKGLAEVSSVTSSSEHKNQSDGDNQRHQSRGRSRPSSRHSAPIYTLGAEYPVGMYGLVSQSVSPHTQVPDPVERDPSPLNLSFSGSIKNIHDETPQERQERRNRLDDLLYAATERSKKEERREARREAREAALREAAAVRDTSVMLTQDPSVLPPVAKRARTSDVSRTTVTLPAHPAFHIPLVNLTLPPNATSSLMTASSISPSQIPQVPEAIPISEHQGLTPTYQDHVTEHQDNKTEQQDHLVQHKEMEIVNVTTRSPIKTEKIDIASDCSVVEDNAVNSDESDTQSAPETPSDLSTTRVATPVPTPTTSQSTPHTHTSTCAAVSEDTSCSSTSATTHTASNASNPSANTNNTNRSSVSPSSSEANDEKITPYFHSILRQAAADGNTSGGGELTSSNTQRVTINMRTFKEEWRRQLLVDYDTRTNMSICMLCFTTFKSYDGPRKNTYVKHAKRFHPSLEDYSEDERDLIINMYEKYHKYDVDMQKEVNKSYRAANAIVALGKKNNKQSDVTTTIITGANGLTAASTGTKLDKETEGQEENSDITPSGEPSVTVSSNHPLPLLLTVPSTESPADTANEAVSLKEEGAPSSSGKNRSHTPENEINLEANEKLSDSFDAEDLREKVDNNNVAVPQHMKRSHMNTRAKSAAAATTVSV